ncbi:putative disease resistance protein At4g19050 [Magnolia sinica]|uniref:putative disease resistance protein At4g19050 n=1 Tax=Magnolia sinica TaxID=86752 RepID=UPI00265AA029|nr:putative disease resistance protein At4g19050 [Magnolia sinica]
MATQGGSDVTTFERQLENFPADVKRAGERLLDCFENPSIGVIGVSGFYGIGGWSIVEYAARKAKESHLFHLQIPVKVLRRDLIHRDMIMEIASQLGLKDASITDDEGKIDMIKFSEVSHKIYKSLRGRRFLLMIGYVVESTEMKFLGVPFGSSTTYDSKIVFIGFSERSAIISNVTIKLEELSADVLREEAIDVAHSRSVEGCFSPDTVLDCFFYLLLFGKEGCCVEWLTRYWIAEGFIGRGSTEEYENLVLEQKNVEALLKELEVHFMVERSDEGRDKWRLPHQVRMASQSLKSASTHGRFWTKASIPRENREWEEIHRMNVWLLKKDTFLPYTPPKCSKLSTLKFGLFSPLLHNLKIVIPDPFFEQMQELRVLMLYGLVNKYLPPSISCLHNLRLLRIQSCNYVQSLPASLQSLHKLEFLELSESSAFMSISEECFQHMTNLRFLCLDKMNIRSLPSSLSKLFKLHQLMLIKCGSLTEIPDESFECMQWLRVLDLSGDSNLKSLPSSLSKLSNLRQLVLANCSSLKMKLLPLLQNLSALEELSLCNCNSLEDIEDVSSSIGNIMPKLRMLDLSGIGALRQLYLHGCQSLESLTLDGLTSLQLLSLSGTRLEKFPENIHRMDGLRWLEMLRMDHIREINWDVLGIELEELNIDQCRALDSSTDDEQPRNRGGARIRVSNSKLLRSLMPSSKLWGAKCFSQFHIYVSPCKFHQRGTGKGINLRQGRQFIYKDIDSKIQKRNVRLFKIHFDRHLEIRGNSSPNGIDGVLAHTELFTLCDNSLFRRLLDFGDVDKMAELKECQVERCDRLETFFEGENASSDSLSLLENIWMSNLGRLRSVCEGTYGSRSFANLKHIRLDYCPKLIVVFSSSVCLQSLEMLEIKFCSRLEAVFEEDAIPHGSLQRLHTVYLWELPKLESISQSIYLSAMKKLRVRGCWKLKKLPLCVGDNDSASNSISGGGGIEVGGELKWWDNLKWENGCIKNQINFKESRRPYPLSIIPLSSKL